MHTTEKALKDLGEKVPPADRANIESAMSDLKRALGGDDKDVIETKANALAQAAAAIAQQAYAQAGAGGRGRERGRRGAAVRGGRRRQGRRARCRVRRSQGQEEGRLTALAVDSCRLTVALDDAPPIAVRARAAAS